MRIQQALLAACVSLVLSGAQAQGFQKLTFDRQGQAGGGTFHLAGPDDPAHPQLWEGPLTIALTSGAQGAAKCDANVSLVKDVYVAKEWGLAVAVTVDGSNTEVFFVNMADCTLRSPRLKAYTEGASVTEDQLQILPGCECPSSGAACSCSAGMVYKLSAHGAPLLLPAESAALTRKVLGVSFSGNRKVSHPKTKRARLAR